MWNLIFLVIFLNISVVSLKHQHDRQGLAAQEMGAKVQKAEREGFIQGTGSIFCYLQGSGKNQTQIRGVGYYRCNFHGGRMVSEESIEGVGWYQCIYQKAGDLQDFEQGIGQYSCSFLGVRQLKGFKSKENLSSMTSMTRKLEGFIEIMGTWTQPIGSQFQQSDFEPFVQLSGFYQYGAEGSDQNYGMLQAIESYNFDIANEVVVYKNSTKKRHDYVTQFGAYEYNFAGANFDQGAGQIGRQFIYNIDHLLEKYGFSLTVGRFEYTSQITQTKQDLVQILGQFARCANPFCAPFANHSEAILIYQLDLGGNSEQFFQFFAEMFREFEGLFQIFGMNPAGSIRLQIIVNWEVNHHDTLTSTSTLIMPGHTRSHTPDLSLLPTFAEIVGTFFLQLNPDREGGFDGALRIAGRGNYVTDRKEKIEARIYIFMNFNYYSHKDEKSKSNNDENQDILDFDFEKWGDYQLALELIYIFYTDEKKNVGSIELFAVYNIDLLKFTENLEILGLGLLQIGGVFYCEGDFLGYLYRKKWGESGQFERECYFQLFFMYTFDVSTNPDSAGGKNGTRFNNPGNVQIMGQYFQEV